jgi:ABC-2 type transport system permease protein
MGTFEILQTTPLSRVQLVVGKYLASLIVVAIALLPTLVYFLSIQRLSGQGGIDTGATIGSYLGLLCLSSVFTAIGVCCSSFTGNAVVAFIGAAFACFLLYSGFGAISQLPVFAAGADYYIEMIGIDFHYRSISRGVIDSRDLIYFLSVLFLFLSLTNRNLVKMVRSNKLSTPKYGWIALIAILVVINLLAGHFHYRLDLTKEKRYTLSAPTKALLGKLDDDVEVDFFLQGDLKSGIRQLSKSTLELLEEFNEYCDGKIRVRTFDPLTTLDDSAKVIFLDSLRKMGIQQMTQVAQSKKGEEQSQRLVIPGAILKYKDKIFPVNLLKGVQVSREGQPEEQLYTNAETLLEYKFGSAIDKITRKQTPAVGYVVGNGEPLDFSVYNLIQDLRGNYRFGVLRLDSVPLIPLQYDALVIVKPTEKFSDREKLALDQYVMHGGKLIWAIDQLHAEMDSLRLDHEVVAYDRGLELEDLFFRYGVRVNQDLVEDMQCASLNLVVGMQGDKPQIQLLPWPYFPLLNGSLTHPISKNLDPVYSKFANSIDTVKAPGIEKTILLQSSDNGRTLGTPALISFESIKQASDPRVFSKPRIPVAVLLEGKFNSLFANRIGTAVADSLANYYKQPFLPAAAQPTGVIVIGDADIVMNEVSRQGPLPMGLNKDINYTFANEDFIQNCVEYLVNPSRILETRSKDYTLRLLDPTKVEEGRSFWQFINIVLPVLLVIIGGWLYQALRKRRYQG